MRKYYECRKGACATGALLPKRARGIRTGMMWLCSASVPLGGDVGSGIRDCLYDMGLSMLDGECILGVCRQA